MQCVVSLKFCRFHILNYAKKTIKSVIQINPIEMIVLIDQTNMGSLTVYKNSTLTGNHVKR